MFIFNRFFLAISRGLGRNIYSSKKRVHIATEIASKQPEIALQMMTHKTLSKGIVGNDKHMTKLIMMLSMRHAESLNKLLSSNQAIQTLFVNENSFIKSIFDNIHTKTSDQRQFLKTLVNHKNLRNKLLMQMSLDKALDNKVMTLLSDTSESMPLFNTLLLGVTEHRASLGDEASNQLTERLQTAVRNRMLESLDSFNAVNFSHHHKIVGVLSTEDVKQLLLSYMREEAAVSKLQALLDAKSISLFEGLVSNLKDKLDETRQNVASFFELAHPKLISSLNVEQRIEFIVKLGSEFTTIAFPHLYRELYDDHEIAKLDTAIRKQLEADSHQIDNRIAGLSARAEKFLNSGDSTINSTIPLAERMLAVCKNHISSIQTFINQIISKVFSNSLTHHLRNNHALTKQITTEQIIAHYKTRLENNHPVNQDDHLLSVTGRSLWDLLTKDQAFEAMYIEQNKVNPGFLLLNITDKAAETHINTIVSGLTKEDLINFVQVAIQEESFSAFKLQLLISQAKQALTSSVEAVARLPQAPALQKQLSPHEVFQLLAQYANTEFTGKVNLPINASNRQSIDIANLLNELDERNDLNAFSAVFGKLIQAHRINLEQHLLDNPSTLKLLTHDQIRTHFIAFIHDNRTQLVKQLDTTELMAQLDWLFKVGEGVLATSRKSVAPIDVAFFDVVSNKLSNRDLLTLALQGSNLNRLNLIAQFRPEGSLSQVLLSAVKEDETLLNDHRTLLRQQLNAEEFVEAHLSFNNQWETLIAEAKAHTRIATALLKRKEIATEFNGKDIETVIVSDGDHLDLNTRLEIFDAHSDEKKSLPADFSEAKRQASELLYNLFAKDPSQTVHSLIEESTYELANDYLMIDKMPLAKLLLDEGHARAFRETEAATPHTNELARIVIEAARDDSKIAFEFLKATHISKHFIPVKRLIILTQLVEQQIKARETLAEKAFLLALEASTFDTEEQQLVKQQEREAAKQTALEKPLPLIGQLDVLEVIEYDYDTLNQLLTFPAYQAVKENLLPTENLINLVTTPEQLNRIVDSRTGVISSTIPEEKPFLAKLDVIRLLQSADPDFTSAFQKANLNLFELFDHKFFALHRLSHGGHDRYKRLLELTTSQQRLDASKHLGFYQSKAGDAKDKVVAGAQSLANSLEATAGDLKKRAEETLSRHRRESTGEVAESTEEITVSERLQEAKATASRLSSWAKRTWQKRTWKPIDKPQAADSTDSASPASSVGSSTTVTPRHSTTGESH